MKQRTFRFSIPLIARTLACASLFLLGQPYDFAQSRAQAPGTASFDVVSIKMNRSGSGSTNMRTLHGRLTASNATVRMLMQAAFHVKDFQITGGPAWVETDRYDIEAKTERTDISDDDLWQLLQPLLSERCKLTFHREAKQLPIYSLVVDKGGPKLKVHSGDDAPSIRVSAGSGKVVVEERNATLAKFADSLSGFLDQTVVDNTGLNAEYDVRLEWYQDHPGEPSPSALGAVEENLGLTGPSIFTAVKEQLGLKLEAAKGPVDIIVIDHIEQPSPN